MRIVADRTDPIMPHGLFSGHPIVSLPSAYLRMHVGSDSLPPYLRKAIDNELRRRLEVAAKSPEAKRGPDR